MTQVNGAHVVGAWTALNGVLAGILIGYGGSWMAIGLYAAAVVIITAFGLAVLLDARYRRGGLYQRMPVRSSAAGLATAGLVLCGLGFVYGWWIAALAVFPLGAAAVLVGSERLGRDVVLHPAPPADLEPQGEAGPASTRTGRRLGLLVLAARTIAAWRRRRSR